METTVWLTGFDLFGGHDSNVSKDVAERLLNQTFDVKLESKPQFLLESESVRIKFEGEILTVDENGSKFTAEKLGPYIPDAIIHLGLKENSNTVNLELCASNNIFESIGSVLLFSITPWQ